MLTSPPIYLLPARRTKKLHYPCNYPHITHLQVIPNYSLVSPPHLSRMIIVSWAIIAESFNSTLPNSLPLSIGPEYYRYICIYISARSVNSFFSPTTTGYWAPSMSRHCIQFWEYTDEKQSLCLLVGLRLIDDYSSETQNDLIASNFHQV